MPLPSRTASGLPPNGASANTSTQTNRNRPFHRQNHRLTFQLRQLQYAHLWLCFRGISRLVDAHDDQAGAGPTANAIAMPSTAAGSRLRSEAAGLRLATAPSTAGVLSPRSGAISAMSSRLCVARPQSGIALRGAWPCSAGPASPNRRDQACTMIADWRRHFGYVHDSSKPREVSCQNRNFTRQKLEHQHTDGVKIGSSVDTLSSALLGGHGYAADPRAMPALLCGGRRAGKLGDAKIDDLDEMRRRRDERRRCCLVSDRGGRRQLCGQRRDLQICAANRATPTWGQHALALEQLAEVFAGQILHDIRHDAFWGSATKS